MADFVKNSIMAFVDGEKVTGQLNVGYAKRIDGYVDVNRVVAIPFSVGKYGANGFSFSISPIHRNWGNHLEDIDTTKFAFAITPHGDESYKDYNGTGDGFISFVKSDAGEWAYDISGSVKKLLLPGDYYLWLFPNADDNVNIVLNYYSSYYKPTYELSGAAGVVRIIENGEELVTMPCVKENGQLVPLATSIKIGDDLIYCV